MKKLFVVALLVLFCLAAVNVQELVPQEYLPLVLKGYAAPARETKTFQIVGNLQGSSVEGSFWLWKIECYAGEPPDQGEACYATIRNNTDTIMVVNTAIITTTDDRVDYIRFTTPVPLAVNPRRGISLEWYFVAVEDSQVGPVFFDFEVTCYWLPIGVSYEEWRIK